MKDKIGVKVEGILLSIAIGIGIALMISAIV